MDKAKKKKVIITALVIITFWAICYLINQQTKKAKAANDLFISAQNLYNYYDEFDKSKELYSKLVKEYPNSPYAAQAKEILANFDADVEKFKIEKAERIEREAKEEARAKAEAEEKRRQHEEAIKPPLQLMYGFVRKNVINNPTAGLVLKNISNKTIDAYTVEIHCYNNYGEPVRHYASGSNVCRGISQESIAPGATYGYNYVWTLHGLENTTKVDIELVKVHCTDGTVWTPEAGQRVSVKGSL